jgi:Zn-dependent M32 family carboxypeptidase
MYEQGISVALDGTPLGHGVSAGVHESQSRLWENMVARSRGFWEHFYPLLQRSFPEQLSGVPLATFHRAINKVTRSLIRTDADEVTYNLHGNILFAQFYAAALEAHPDIPPEIASGEFRTLHTWLHNNLYRHGSKFAPNDLVKRATDKAMTIKPYLDYLREKYCALYRLPASVIVPEISVGRKWISAR